MKTYTPKQLFLIDGIGAIISALLLGVILVKFEENFGIPKSTLYFLAVLPIFFAVFDFYCYLKVKLNHHKFLKIIALFNVTYCFISISFAFYHTNTITTMGWIYIISEVLVILILSFIELKTANKLSN